MTAQWDAAHPKYEMIGQKPVYVVAKHQFVLSPWAEVRRQLAKPPILITLDHHTDTRFAFGTFAYSQKHYDDRGSAITPEKVIRTELERINFEDPRTIEAAISHLENDEHISAAIESRILDHAYAITFREEKGDPLAERIFHVPPGCWVGCTASQHDQACHVEQSAQAIESKYLASKLQCIAEISPSFGVSNVLDESFILDIDLDYFHSERSILPKDSSLIYRLIQRSIAITIATEALCVFSHRLPGESITPDWLLQKLKEHIRTAQLEA